MKLRVGTSGYSYKEWKGSFYPPKIAPGEMLAHYASRLPAVEINNTFYRMPKTEVLESWAAQVPPEFRFAIKASRRITHNKRLKDAADETGYLLRATAVLGERLGIILFQLPPNMKCDVPRLEAFLELLPEGTRAAFEFRHESWRDDGAIAALRARGCALCAADVDDEPPPEVVVTGPCAYLRLRREQYGDDDLRAWHQRLSASGLEECFVFFKHEDAGAGPALAARFMELA